MGGLFPVLLVKSTSKLQKTSILHTFQANGGAIAPFAPLPSYASGRASAESRVQFQFALNEPGKSRD